VAVGDISRQVPPAEALLPFGGKDIVGTIEAPAAETDTIPDAVNMNSDSGERGGVPTTAGSGRYTEDLACVEAPPIDTK